MNEKALPPDCIRLGNGEYWKVPLLPGGTSEDAVKTVDLYLKCKEEIKRLGVKNSISEIQRTRIEEDDQIDEAEKERRYAEISAEDQKHYDEWVRFQMSVGFEFLRMLYNAGREEPVGEMEARALFPVTGISIQLLRATAIALTGSTSVGEGSDFSPQDKDSLTTANGG